MTIFAIDSPYEQLKAKNMYTVDYLKTLHADYVEWNPDPGSMIMPEYVYKFDYAFGMSPNG